MGISHLSGECSEAKANDQQKAELLKIVKESFGTLLIPKATGMQTPLQNLVRNGTRALVAMPGVNDPSIFSSNVFLNDYANTPNVEQMVAHNTGLVSKLRSSTNQSQTSQQLTKLSWTLTPSEDTLMKSILSCGSIASASSGAATSL